MDTGLIPPEKNSALLNSIAPFPNASGECQNNEMTNMHIIVIKLRIGFTYRHKVICKRLSADVESMGRIIQYISTCVEVILNVLSVIFSIILENTYPEI